MPSPQLHPAQSSFEALAESAPDAILTIDAESTIISANPATERVFGYKPEELMGQKLTMLMPERLRASHRHGIARYVGTGRRNIPWTGIELQALRKDGQEIPVEIAFGEFVDESGRRLFSGFVRDVTERVRQKKEVEAAVRARDEVLSVVSHDLRNPVSTIAMSASLLSDPEGQLTDDERREQFSVIARSADRMNRLIQDLVDVASIQGGRLTISCRCEDAGQLAAEACEAFRSIAADKELHLDCDIEKALRPVYADRDRVLQLLSNYLNNAVKFTPERGRIVVRVRRSESGGVRYSVSNNGPGIPPEELPHVFNRFWQSKHTAHLGSGLGLAIALGVAQAHRGRVWVESAPGVETTFYFELPHSKECG
jgi:PAS domain S-box-containing protein